MKFVHRHGMGHLDPGLERRRPRRRSLGLNFETGNGWGDAINGGLPHENEGLQSMTILWGTPNSWKIGPFWYWKLWFWGTSFYPSLRHIHIRILVWRSGTTTLLVLVVNHAMLRKSKSGSVCWTDQLQVACNISLMKYAGLTNDWKLFTYNILQLCGLVG